MRGIMTILFGIVVTLWSWGDVGRAGDSARPNILAIRGDDIGRFNVDACDRGMMGGKFANIDDIANQGTLFIDA